MKQSPYLIFPIIIFLITAYLIGILLVKTGILSKVTHRKIWNSVLLITFLVSGILGLLIAIQINYKLEWPIVKKLLTWHVDFGIAMCIVSIFHLIWHLDYYVKLFQKNQPTTGPSTKTPKDVNSGRLINLLIVVLGFFTTTVQVLLIREITTVFQGNELMMAWTIGIWMFLTGSGTWLGRSFYNTNLPQIVRRIFTLLSYLPIGTIILINLCKHLFFLPGELVNPFGFLVIMIILLAPLCLLAGFAYSLLIHVQKNNKDKIINVYSFESAGSLIGGIVASFLLIRWVSISQAMLLVAIVIHLVLLFEKTTLRLIFSVSILMSGLILFFVLPVDRTIKSVLFQNQKVLKSQETFFGNLTITENAGEYSFFENGSLLFATGDIIQTEEYVHYAMLQHPAPENILLISGGISGMLDETLKYPTVKNVSYVELNSQIIKLGRLFKPLPNDNRLHVIYDDGRRFIQQSNHRFDVIILAVPDPSSLHINRFYTTEFFKILKQKITKNGVVLCAVSSSGNYLGPEKKQQEASIYNSIKGHFKYFVIIPGEKDYFIGSDSPLSANIAELSDQRNITASYVNSDYMDDRSIVNRGTQIQEQLNKLSILNTDNQPIPVFYESLHYLSQFVGRKFYWLLIPFILLLSPVLFLKPVSSAMYITGFTAASVEILLIFWFQIVLGYIYAAIGLIFAIFMGGLALGSYWGSKTAITRNHFLAGQGLLALYPLILALLWDIGKISVTGSFIWMIFIPVLLILATLTGFQYASTTFIYLPDLKKSAAIIYSADLWGSALGAILLTFFMAPLLGFKSTCLLIAGLNLIAILLNLRKQNT